MRFASEGTGVIYSNRRIKDQWVVATAWQEKGGLAVELSGIEVGGPHPLDPPTAFGTDPVIGAGTNDGPLDQPFQGFLGEVLVFNRNLEDAERHRIDYSLMSRWFGWLLPDPTYTLGILTRAEVRLVSAYLTFALRKSAGSTWCG